MARRKESKYSMPMRINIKNLRKNKMTEETKKDIIKDALKKKQEEKKKAEMNKKIDKLMKVANKKANDIMSMFEDTDRSIRWAELFLQQLSGTIDSAFLTKRNTMKVNQLDIKVQIPEKDENDAYVKVLAMLKDLTVIEAIKILEGMTRVIEGKINQDKNTKKIKELEIVFTNEPPKA